MFVGALSWSRARARAWAYETRSAFISADLSILNMSLLISQYYGRIAVIEMPAIFVLRVFNRQADNRGGVIKRKRGAERGKERILHIQWYAEKHKLLWLFVSVPYSLHVRLYYQIKFDKDLTIYWAIYLIRRFIRSERLLLCILLNFALFEMNETVFVRHKLYAEVQYYEKGHHLVQLLCFFPLLANTWFVWMFCFVPVLIYHWSLASHIN